MATQVPEINEFVFNHVGTDTNEYIEVEGPPATSLAGDTLVVLDGDGGEQGVVDNVIAVGTTNAAGYWVTPFLTNQLQNGSQTLLLVSGNTATVGEKLDPAHTGTLATVPWTAVLDGVAVSAGGASDLFYTPVVLTPNFDGQNNVVGGASRIPDGTSTGSVSDWERNDFNLAGLPGKASTPAAGDALNTPGATNVGSAAASKPAPLAATVQAINGPGYLSPLNGRAVSTTGIVTAVELAGSIGYWVQDPAANAVLHQSSAVFVYTGSATGLPSVGSSVSVTGTVSEYLPGGAATNIQVTELGSPVTTVLSTGNALPAAIVLGPTGLALPTGTITSFVGNLNTSTAPLDVADNAADFYRAIEGERVTIPAAVVVGATDQYGDTWVLADGGAGNPSPTPDGGILATSASMNPQRLQVVPDTGVLPGFNPGLSSVGDTLGNVTGVLTYDFGEFQVTPTQAYTPTSGGLVPGVTSFAPDASHLLVADYNIENFNPQAGSRIAQLAQIIGTNLHAPDVIALQEVQDGDGPTDDGLTSSAATAQAIIAAVKAATGITYAYADIAPVNDTSGGQPGGNIRNGFLYNPARVTLVPGSLASITDPNGAFASSRNPLVGQFSFNGQVVTLVNVHNTSQSGSTELFGSTQPYVKYGDAQRQAQAHVITGYVQGLVAANPAAKVEVLGDFNDFDFSPAQQVYTGGSNPLLTDLNLKEPADARFTYDFEGNSESLDHSLATSALYAAADFQTVHVNSQFPEPVQESDHDPSLTLIALPVQAACYVAGTRLLTPAGERPIESLRPGDLLVTAAGTTRPVRWVGRRTIECTQHPEPARVQPVRVQAGAFGPGLPHAELWLSPGHAVRMEGGLVPVELLLNGATIAQVAVPRVTYHHVELDAHDLVLAHGLAAESYLDVGNRHAFEGEGALLLHPDLSARAALAADAARCLPLLGWGEAVVAARAALLARAEALGHATEASHGLHLLADGRPVAPSLVEGEWHHFAVPEGTDALVLASRSWVPSHVRADCNDHRELGVCVLALVLDGRPVPLAAAMPGPGWHAPCAEGALHRWTDGAATLPAGLRAVAVLLGGERRYRVATLAA